MFYLLKYQTFKEYYWKCALLKIGLPWGFATGIFISINHNSWSLKGILSIETLIEVVGMTLAGFLFAYLYGKSNWQRIKDFRVSQEIEGNESGEKKLKEN
jgi:hypothetical protein